MRIINVAKVIVRRPNGDVLLLRRSPTSTHAGNWDIPGGGAEQNESHLQAAIREAEEEAGLKIADLKVLYAATVLDESKQESVNRMLFYAKLDQNPEITLSFEHDEFQWLPLSKVKEVFTHPMYSTGLKYAEENHLI